MMNTMGFGIVTLLTLMAVFIGSIMIKRDKFTGMTMAIMLMLSVSLSYVTMGIGQYKSSLDRFLSSGITYDVLYYDFPSHGPARFLLKAEGSEYPKYYLIDMTGQEKEKAKSDLKRLEQKIKKLGHGQIQIGKNKGTENEDYGFAIDPNEHRPELRSKEE